MRSSFVCINESGPETVTVDFSRAATDLANRETNYGFALMKTFEHLGVELEYIPSPNYPNAQLHVSGSVETVLNHLPELQRHIGLIARFGPERKTKRILLNQYNRGHIGSILGKLVQRQLPLLPDNASLMRATGLIVEPFADALSDDETRVYYARQAPWHAPDDVVKSEDGSPLGRFSVRDIGGLLIGPNGLPAREKFNSTLVISEADTSELILIARAKESSLASELSYMFRNFLDNPHKPAIDRLNFESDARKVLTSFERVDLEQLDEVDFAEGASFNDLIRTLIKQYLLDSQSDTEIQAKVDAEKQELALLYGNLSYRQQGLEG